MLNLLSKVNPLQGTDSTREFSTGNTLPIVARPWGMNHWTLQTGKAPWIFNRGSRRLWGVRLTHQPSPWMRDYASLMITPFVGEIHEKPEHQASAYRVEESVLRPNYLRTKFLRYGVTMELAPTERGAILRFDFKGSEAPRLAFRFDGDHELQVNAAGELIGVTRDNHGGVADHFGLHFIGLFSTRCQNFTKTDFGGCVTFEPGVHRVELRLATSFISPAMARNALELELLDSDFEGIESEGGRIWNELLGRIEIESSDAQQEKTFYSCLYRCLLFPRFLDEVDGDGKAIHYSPYDGKVHEGPLCTDNGFWDTYRTLYPLLALVYPDKLNRMLQGWMNACRQAGWAPKWASPGLRDCMIGTHFNSVVADAVVKGITDWDVAGAFDFLWKDATVPSTDGCYGRRGLDLYLRHGYIPTDKEEHAVSSTLDYAYDDFCVAQVARHLGRTSEAQELLRRSQFFRNVFDPSVGFMRGRLASGEWLPNFNEFTWGGPFIEGGAWQHVFNVPHAIDDLATLFGGKEALCRKLDAMLATPARFESGTYGYEIHEMTEMAVAKFGQYAHSNQPVHNFLFLYALAGEPAKTSYWVRRVLNELYTPDSLPGDEDNGEMSAWYIWASLGLFPYCPGKASYVRFDSIIAHAEVRIPGRDAVLILGSSASQLKRSASKTTLISHSDLLKKTSLESVLIH